MKMNLRKPIGNYPVFFLSGNWIRLVFMGVFQIDGNERTWKTAGNFHEHKNSWGYLEDGLPVTWVPLRPTFFINGWMFGEFQAFSI